MTPRLTPGRTNTASRKLTIKKNGHDQTTRDGPRWAHILQPPLQQIVRLYPRQELVTLQAQRPLDSLLIVQRQPPRVVPALLAQFVEFVAGQRGHDAPLRLI